MGTIANLGQFLDPLSSYGDTRVEKSPCGLQYTSRQGRLPGPASKQLQPYTPSDHDSYLGPMLKTQLAPSWGFGKMKIKVKEG